MPTVIEGTVIVPARAKVAIVASRFNHFIVEKLEAGAVDAFVRHGGNANDVTIVRVPGAWELPVALEHLARRGGFAAMVGLSAVIRGSTPHFDYVAGEVSKGVAQVSLNHALPIGFGVLTTDTIEQAVERAGTKAGNKGWDAMVTAIEMMNVVASVSAPAKQARR